MDSILFTPKEKYHIASTIVILFLILSIINLFMPYWLVRAYSWVTVILFGYVAIRNYIKMSTEYLTSLPEDDDNATSEELVNAKEVAGSVKSVSGRKVC
jgi:hypothetical protein